MKPFKPLLLLSIVASVGMLVTACDTVDDDDDDGPRRTSTTTTTVEERRVVPGVTHETRVERY
jgi:hypothetical protein